MRAERLSLSDVTSRTLLFRPRGIYQLIGSTGSNRERSLARRAIVDAQFDELERLDEAF